MNSSSSQQQMVTKTKQNRSPNLLNNHATHSQPKKVFHSNITEYEVGKLVGSGSFGQVYAAKTKTGFPVAIKIIEKKRAIRQRVEAEERIHSSLKHPSIINFLHRFEDQQNVYFVLELAKGNLYKFLLSRTQFLSEGFIARLFKQLVQGVKYLRKQGVAHRDIKPSNLLLCPSTSYDKNDHNNNSNNNLDDQYEVCLKIGDLGLAAKLEEVTSDFRTFCGTREFMAPEISKQKYGLEADLYSLGMVLYALLVSGVGQNLKAKLKNLSQNHQFEFPKHSSIHARDLVMKLLQEDPEERPLPEEVLLHPFVVLNTQSNTQSQQPPSTTPTPHIIINHTTNNNLPLNTKRIKPLELKTKWGMAWITEEHDLCLQPHPQRIFRIANNGLNFYVLAPSVHQNSPSQHNTQILEQFSFPSLPEKYLRWYEYGRLFLETVRARIPKITLYTDFCRGILMESMSHFEAVFFSNSRSPTPSSTGESGIKILYTKADDRWSFSDNPMSNYNNNNNNTSTTSFSPNSHIHLKSQMATFHTTHSSTSSGSTTGTLSPSPSTSRSSSSTNSNPSFSLTPHEMLDHAKSCYKMCLQYERVISQDDDIFPIEIIKRKKSISPSPSRITTSTLSFYSPPSHPSPTSPTKANEETTNATKQTTKNPDTPYTTTATHDIDTQNTQLQTQQNATHTTTTTTSLDRPPQLAPVFLKSIGWAFRMHLTGEIWFQFHDGTQIVLSSDAKTIQYTPLLGNTSFHEVSYSLPKQIQEKISYFPAFFELMKDAQ